MTIARRVAAVEAALTPTELVLRWLDEAHAHGDLEGYVRSQLADSPADTPINRLAREAVTGATAATKGRGTEATRAAVRVALGGTVFRFDLIMRIITTTHELLDRQALLDAVLAGQLAMQASANREEPDGEPARPGRLAWCRDLLLSRANELEAANRAREAVEARYLGGHPAVFPDTLAAWEEQVRGTRALAAMAVRLAELDGVPLPAPLDAEAVSARADRLVADLVEPAKVTALEKLGEGERAYRIAAGWVRGKLGAADPLPPATR